MDLKGSVCVALFLSLNLLSLSIVTSQPCPDLEQCLLDVVNVGWHESSPFSTLPLPTVSSGCCGILQGLGARAGACLCSSVNNTLGINFFRPFDPFPSLTNAVVVKIVLNNCGVTNSEFDQFGLCE
ncbi:hypothetical protein ACSQ67_019969 [Phaseolus vulgaris]